MRGQILLFTILSCVMTLVWSAAVEQAQQDYMSDAENLLNVDSDVEHANEGPRQTRQFLGAGYYGRPYYGGYGGYGSPYYGGYNGLGYPYYGGYGGLGSPYYGFGFYG